MKLDEIVDPLADWSLLCPTCGGGDDDCRTCFGAGRISQVRATKLVAEGGWGIVQPSRGSLWGLHICATGKLHGYTRTGIANKITNEDGIFHSSPTKKTDYLLTGYTNASVEKVTRAKGNGTQIITETDFEKMLT